MGRLTIPCQREKFGYCPAIAAGEYFGFFIVTDTILGLQEKVDFFVRLENDRERGG